MVSTRTQRGVITTQKYDPKTLKEHEIFSPVGTGKTVPIDYKSPRSPRSRHRGSRKHLVGKRPARKTGKAPANKLGDEVPLTTREYSPYHIDKGELEEVLKNPQLKVPDLSSGIPNFFPRTAFGEYEVVGKSKIQRADCLIEKYEIIREAHLKNHPQIVPLLDVRIKEAKQARMELEDNKENNRVG